MANIGVFCLPMASHMNLFFALGRKLQERGHQITFFGISDNQRKTCEAGFSFQQLEPASVPVGTLGSMMRQMGELSDLACMKMQGDFDRIRFHGILSQAPDMVAKAGISALLIDQAEACTGSVAELLNLPWISVCNGLCLNSEPDIPPFLTAWPYRQAVLARARNVLAYYGLRIATRSHQNLINNYRKKWNLKPLTSMEDTFSPFAQICQQNQEFDFPRQRLPSTFHYVGPIKADKQRLVDFPWERLDGRPLIYATLGTVVNRNQHLYRLIAEACAGLPAQLVLSLGGGGNAEQYSTLPGHPVVVSFAPQRELLARAALTITHGGLNTTLESLSAGVPLLAIPITFEQPAIAARIRWTGTGQFVKPKGLDVKRLRSAIQQVLGAASCREAAERMKQAIAKTDGCNHASDIVEEVIRTRKPVRSQR